MLGRPVQLTLLTLAAVVACYARTAIGPLQETLRMALHLSDNQMASLQGPAMAFPVVLAALPLGLLIDRYTRVRLLLSFAVLTLLGSLLTSSARSYPALFAARCLTGLVASATLTAVFSLLADYFPQSQRGRANMVIAIGQVAGSSAAFALGGWLLAEFAATPAGWRPAMFWLSVPILPVAGLLVLLQEPPRSERSNTHSTVRATLAELWNYRAVAVPLLAGVVTVSIADCAAFIWAAPVFARRFALSSESIGAIMAGTVLVSGIVGALAGGFLADFCQRAGGPKRTMDAQSVLVLLSLPASFFAIMPTPGLTSVFLGFFLVIGGVLSVTATTLATLVIPNQLRGLFLAALFAFGTIFGIGLAPLIVSLLADRLGGLAKIAAALAIVCATTSLLGAIAFAGGRRHFSSQGDVSAPES